MRFRRKPIERDVVDAVKAADGYVYVNGDGKLQTVPHADFERDYEAILRVRVKKERKPRKTKPQQPPPQE